MLLQLLVSQSVVVERPLQLRSFVAVAEGADHDQSDYRLVAPRVLGADVHLTGVAIYDTRSLQACEWLEIPRMR